MGLTVRSSRCAVTSMIIFGFLILIPATAYIAFSIIFGFLRLLVLAAALDTYNGILQISWYLGYPSLLAILTMITGCVGCCASSYRIRHDTCQTSTLFIFSLIVAGLSSYTIYNFSNILAIGSVRLLHVCNMKAFCSSLILSLEGTLLAMAILILLLSCWTMICCIASFCCDNEIAPAPESGMVVGGQHQGVTLQGAVVVPMMQANQPMVQANPSMVQAVPVMQTSQAPMCQCNQATEMQNQGMPMKVVATPVVLAAQE